MAIALVMAGLAEETAPALAEPPKLTPDPSFIDPRSMARHAGLDLPALIMQPDLPWVEPLMPAKSPWPVEFNALGRAAAAAASVAATGGYQGNGAISTQGLLARQEGADLSLVGAVRHDHAHPYQDGGGDRVNFAYDRTNAQMAAGWRPNPDRRLSAYAATDSFINYRDPGYGIDAPKLQRNVASSVYEQAPPESGLGLVQAAVTTDLLGYRADNVTLRTPGSLGLAYTGRSATTRALVRGQIDTGPVSSTITLDGGVGAYNIDIVNLFPSIGTSAFRIPEVQTVQGGLTYAGQGALAPGRVLGVGVRVDSWHSEAGRRSDIPSVSGSGSSSFAVSPQSLWNTYYGAGTQATSTIVAVSARVNYQHDIEDGRITADLRRAVRNPDYGERFYANGGPASVTQVGNPQLAPEAHHRAEIGLRRDGNGFKGSFDPASPAGSWRVAASGYGDRVVDFVTADRARMQSGVLMNNQAIIYRNVEAYLVGAQGEAWWQLTDGVAARARLAWMRGGNMTDRRPLYQVPPLEGEAVLEHRRPVAAETILALGLRVSFAATQNRIDGYAASGSGQDTGRATAGWTLFDMFFGLDFDQRFAVTGGVANVLDKHYHQHVYPLPQSPTTRFQEAPGRNAFVMTTMTF